jgi:hypothetical protein
MATDKQNAANRRNAVRSTGPRTLSGKARSRRNSIRHGLLSKVMADPALVGEARKLAIRIAREHGRPDHCVEAQTVAEAELTILQARAARARVLDMSPVARTPRSERSDGRMRSEALMAIVGAGDNDLASAYLERLPMLTRLDRYEKTALLRRQRALRSLCPLR